MARVSPLPPAMPQVAYITSLFLDNYVQFHPHIETAAFLALGDDEKNSLIAQATRLLEELLFVGTPVSVEQDLAWPRDGVRSRNGGSYENSGVPIELADACAELTIWLFQQDRFSESYTEGTSLDGVGSVRFNRRAKGKVPAYVRKMITHLTIGSPNQIQRV